MSNFFSLIKREFRDFLRIKPYNRSWHIALLAALGVGIPLFVGLYFDNLSLSLMAGLGGLVSLYYSLDTPFPIRMIKLMVCSFGFVISFTVGLLFSFDSILSSVTFGLLSVVIHWIVIYYKTKPPGSFFFIMVGAMASYLPHDMEQLPARVGMMAIGTMFTCLLGLIYGLLTHKRNISVTNYSLELKRNRIVSAIESLIIGIFMFLALIIGHLMKFENPYWLPISCLAVLQGVSRDHVWRRVYHRVIGTFVGVGICWLLLSFFKTPLEICIVIFLLQFIIELVVTRHYALAVVFITPMTILLSEVGSSFLFDRDVLILSRLTDITIGSILGAIGGWIIYHQSLKHKVVRRVLKSNILNKRNRK